MPIPVLAGIPWLASLLASFFGALFAWFGKYFTKKLAIAAAMVATLAAMTGVFWVAIDVAMSAISVTAPPYFSQAVGLVVPSNINACISSLLTARVARWLYDMKVKVLLYTNAGAGY